MVNFVENPQARGNELNSQVAELVRRSVTYQEEYARWNSERESLTEKFKETFHSHFHDAFQALGDLTSAILACTDEELNVVTCEADIPASAVTTRNLFQHVRQARDAFHKLTECSEAGLKDVFSRYSQEVFVEESGFFNLEKELDDAFGNITNEYRRADEKRDEYWREFEIAQREYEDLSRKLEEYDRMDWFEQLFAKNAWDMFGDRWRSQEQVRNSLGWRHTRMREFKELVERLPPQLHDQSETLKRLHQESIQIENALIDMKTNSYEVCRKIGAMENCLLDSDMEVSVEEATRHVLNVTYVSIEMIESDSFARNLKGQILTRVSEKFGREKTEELKHERQYLPLEI